MLPVGWYPASERACLAEMDKFTAGTKALPAGATVLAKVEGRNPAYSVKCRIGASMVWDAEEKGILKPGMPADARILPQ